MQKRWVYAMFLAMPLAAFAYTGENDYGQPVDHKLESLTQLLQLTPEQKSKLEAIFKEQHEKFRAIHEESHSRIKQVLNPEQMRKMDELRKQHKERMQEDAQKSAR